MGQRSIFGTILIGATVFMIAGCTQEQRLQGTVAGFKGCLEKALKQGLLPSGQRAHCLGKHEHNIPVKLEGKAGYNGIFARGLVYFEGYVENKSTDYVVTNFTVVLKRLDKDMVQSEAVKAHLEPGDEHKIYINDLEYTPNEGENGKDKFEWYIDNIRGLKISTD